MPNYDIFIDENGLTTLELELKKIYSNERIFVVVDQFVNGIYRQTLTDALPSYQLTFITIPEGEESKSISVYLDVVKQLIIEGMKRNHLLIALGGGVTGDLVGFVASTLYRGVPFIQIPTTLLAMVDSSIGSKVGIDLEEGKNLIGSFYDPKMVYINYQFLTSLTKREYANGLAEMIKSGLIGDKHLYHYLLEHDRVTIKEIQMALQVKREVVITDPFDHRERMFLNFGHTFGHAIEKKHNYLAYKHGEAISYGMLMALEVGIKHHESQQELYDEVKDLLIRRGLVTEPLLRREDYIDMVKNDKKMKDDVISFIVVTKVGNAKIIPLKENDLL
jgi:3-dehydroquinate synthase